MPALEIQVFSPSITKPLPSRRAAVVIDATSDPDAASDSAKAAILRPARTAGR